MTVKGTPVPWVQTIILLGRVKSVRASRAPLFETLCPVARQAPLSMGVSRQEH